MPIIPVKNAHTARIAAISIGIASERLLKKVSPPLCPDAIKKENIMKNRMETRISLTDHLPNTVLDLYLILILPIILLNTMRTKGEPY